MLEHKLVGEFFRVTGIAFSKKERFPQHLCSWCATFMKRCASFRAKCLRANQCLQQLGGNLTADHLLTIDRHANQLVHLTRTQTVIDSIDGVDIPANIKDEPDGTDVKVCNVQKEVYMEINSLNEKEIAIDVVKENDTIDTAVNNTDDIFDVEYLDMSDDDIYDISIKEPALSSEPAKSDLKKDVIDVSISNETRNTETSDNTEVKMKRRKRGKYDTDTENRDIVETKRVKKVYTNRSAEDGFMPNVNLEEFKENYDVDIHVLTYVHLKQNPGFPCPNCETGFTNKAGVKLHVDSVHRGLPGPVRNRRKRIKAEPIQLIDL